MVKECFYEREMEEIGLFGCCYCCCLLLLLLLPFCCCLLLLLVLLQKREERERVWDFGMKRERVIK